MAGARRQASTAQTVDAHDAQLATEISLEVQAERKPHISGALIPCHELAPLVAAVAQSIARLRALPSAASTAHANDAQLAAEISVEVAQCGA